MDEETKEMIVQFQNYQQQLQGVLIQKESMKLQIMEIENSVKELEESKAKEAYKITGQIMVAKPAEELKKDLNETKEAIDLRIKSLEKSEERVTNKLKELQEKLREVMK